MHPQRPSNPKIIHTSSSISKLPYDVLQEIFYLYVRADRQSPRNLALTCKEWHKTAMVTNSLWNHVYLGGKEGRWSNPDKVYCSNLFALGLAMRRIGTTPFELVINSHGMAFTVEEVEQFASMVDGTWLSRCTSLCWLQIKSLAGWTHFLRLFIIADYASLKRFELWGVTEPIAAELDAIMNQLHNTAFHLTHLTFHGRSSDWSPRRLMDYPRLVPRIRQLRTDTSDIITWNGLSALESLDITTSGTKFRLFLPESKLLQRVSVTGTFAFYLLHTDIYRQLTHLTVISDAPWWEKSLFGGSHTVSLPSLEFLEIRGSWLAIPPIETTVLDTLIVIPNPSGFKLKTLVPFKLARLHPRIFRLDKTIHNEDILELVGSIGPRLEELHFTFPRPSDTFPAKLAAALCKTSPTRLFPQLQVLTILSPTPNSLRGPKTQMQALRTVSASYTSLRVRHGWYTSSMPYSWNEPERKKDWRIQWHDLT